MDGEQVQSSRGRTVARWVLAGPVALIVSVVVLAGSTKLLPPGAGGINHLALPMISFPLYWAAVFFYAVLDRNLWRVAAIFVAVAAFFGFLIYRGFIS